MLNIPVIKSDLNIFVKKNNISIIDNLPLNFIIPKYKENFLDCLGYTLSVDTPDNSRLLFAKTYSGNITDICMNKLSKEYNQKIINNIFTILLFNLSNFKFIELEKFVDNTTYNLIQGYLKLLNEDHKGLNIATTAYLLNNGILNLNNINNFDTRCINSLKHALKRANYDLIIEKYDNGLIYTYIEDYVDIYNSEIPI